MAVLDEVLMRLQREYATGGKAELFAAIKASLSGEVDALSYAGAGRQLGMSEGAVKVAAHRLRGRYRELLKDEIAQTVATADQINEEIQHLLSCL